MICVRILTCTQIHKEKIIDVKNQVKRNNLERNDRQTLKFLDFKILRPKDRICSSGVQGGFP